MRFSWVSNLDTVVFSFFPHRSNSSWADAKIGCDWVPQARQTNLSSRSDSLTWPGHLSPLIAVEWLQR
jgi:hypothetical protein